MSERKCLRSNEKNTTNNILASAKLHVPKISYVCLANRSACFLKLGHPEKALDDAESCVKLDPSYIKGVFRQGMALHALERFEEAIPVLAKSLEMEPKNKQVKQVRVGEGGGGWGVGGCEKSAKRPNPYLISRFILFYFARRRLCNFARLNCRRL